VTAIGGTMGVCLYERQGAKNDHESIRESKEIIAILSYPHGVPLLPSLSLPLSLPPFLPPSLPLE